MKIKFFPNSVPKVGELWEFRDDQSKCPTCSHRGIKIRKMTLVKTAVPRIHATCMRCKRHVGCSLLKWNRIFKPRDTSLDRFDLIFEG